MEKKTFYWDGLILKTGLRLRLISILTAPFARTFDTFTTAGYQIWQNLLSSMLKYTAEQKKIHSLRGLLMFAVSFDGTFNAFIDFIECPAGIPISSGHSRFLGGIYRNVIGFTYEDWYQHRKPILFVCLIGFLWYHGVERNISK